MQDVIQVQKVSGPPDGLKDQVRVNTLSMSFRAPLKTGIQKVTVPVNTKAHKCCDRSFSHTISESTVMVLSILVNFLIAFAFKKRQTKAL